MKDKRQGRPYTNADHRGCYLLVAAVQGSRSEYSGRGPPLATLRGRAARACSINSAVLCALNADQLAAHLGLERAREPGERAQESGPSARSSSPQPRGIAVFAAR